MTMPTTNETFVVEDEKPEMLMKIPSELEILDSFPTETQN